MRAAIIWALEQELFDIASQFGLYLRRYWHIRGYFVESRDWLMRIIAAQAEHARNDPSLAARQAELLVTAGGYQIYTSNYSTARALMEEALDIAKRHNMQEFLRVAYIYVGNAARFQRDYATAIAMYEEGVRASGEGNDELLLANALWSLGTAKGENSDLEEGERLLRQALSIARRLNDIYVLHGALRDLGSTLCYESRYLEAADLVEEAIATAESNKVHVHVAPGWSLTALGFASLGMCDLERAEALFRESLLLSHTAVKHGIPDNLDGIAEVMTARAAMRDGSESAQRGLENAAILLGAADAARRILDSPIVPVRAPQRERLVAQVQTVLGWLVYERAYSSGQGMGAWKLRSPSA